MWVGGGVWGFLGCFFFFFFFFFLVFFFLGFVWVVFFLVGFFCFLGVVSSCSGGFLPQRWDKFRLPPQRRTFLNKPDFEIAICIGAFSVQFPNS